MPRPAPQSKWGNVAKAVGSGLMALGELNYREKMEKLRQENLEKTRLANQKFQREMAEENRAFQAEEGRKNREYQSGEKDKDRDFKNDDREDRQEHESGEKAKDRTAQKEIYSTRSGKTNSTIQLIEYYKNVHGMSNEEARAAANTLREKSPRAIYAEMYKLIAQTDEYQLGQMTQEEVKQRAEEMTQQVLQYGGGGLAQPGGTNTDTGKGKGKYTDTNALFDSLVKPQR